MKAGKAVLPVASKQGSQKADLVCGKSAILLWYLPAFALIASLNWAPARGWLWIPAFLVMSAACLVNAARCGDRVPCWMGLGPVLFLRDTGQWLGDEGASAGLACFGESGVESRKCRPRGKPADCAVSHSDGDRYVGMVGYQEENSRVGGKPSPAIGTRDLGSL